MQKVEGSSPFIRSENPCKSADAVVGTGDDGCFVAAVVSESSCIVLVGTDDSRLAQVELAGGRSPECPANRRIQLAIPLSTDWRPAGGLDFLSAVLQKSAEGHFPSACMGEAAPPPAPFAPTATVFARLSRSHTLWFATGCPTGSARGSRWCAPLGGAHHAGPRACVGR
jgi:hypothetical protein